MTDTTAAAASTTTKATTAAPKRTWTEIASKFECDGSDGEVFLSSSRGKMQTLKACQESCEESLGCKSISYYNTKWCSHFGTLCTKTKWNKKVVMSLRIDFVIPDTTAVAPTKPMTKPATKPKVTVGSCS